MHVVVEEQHNIPSVIWGGMIWICMHKDYNVEPVIP
jgi:hypothetical protein